MVRPEAFNQAKIETYLAQYSPQVLELKKQLSRTGLGLDLDDTVSISGPVWVARASSRFGRPDGLSDQELLSRFNNVESIPTWQQHPHFQAWLQAARLSKKFIKQLKPIDQAVKHTNRIHSSYLPIHLYLTARAELTQSATVEWLSHNRLPKSPVISRPSQLEYEQASFWKAQVLTYLHPQVCGIVDDSLSLAQALAPDYPGTIFLFGHTEKPDNPLNIIPCPDWNAVLAEIKLRYPQSLHSQF